MFQVLNAQVVLLTVLSVWLIIYMSVIALCVSGL